MATSESTAEAELAQVSSLLDRGVAQRLDLRELASQLPCQQRSPLDASSALLRQFRAEGVKMLALADAVRLKLPNWDSDWLYGEIEASEAASLLTRELVPRLQTSALPNERLFADVGCGSGKAVLGAALSGEFGECVGVEALPSLATVASMLVEDFQNQVLHKSLQVPHDVSVRALHGDAVGCGIPDCDAIGAVHEWATTADVVLCNCATWSDSLLKRLADVCARYLKQGAVVCVVLAELKHESLEQLDVVEVKATWGHAEACVYVKT